MILLVQLESVSRDRENTSSDSPLTLPIITYMSLFVNINLDYFAHLYKVYLYTFIFNEFMDSRISCHLACFGQHLEIYLTSPL